MNLIPENVDLTPYLGGPDFAPKVRPASDFRESVKKRLAGEEKRVRGPTINSIPKAYGIEFRDGEVTAWVGYNGHRKSMFTSQVGLDLCNQRRRVLIVSLEMDPADTMERMTRQATGEETPHPKIIDRFNDWTDDKLWLFDHVGNLSVEHTIALCRYFAEKHNGTDVFLDSMMMICTSEERLDEQKFFATSLVRLAQETGLHVHVITHCRKPAQGDESKLPSRYEIRGSSAISDQAQNVMVVWMNKKKFATLESDKSDANAREAALNEPCAVVKCDKQRKGKWEGKLQLWHDDRSLRFVQDRISPIHPYVFLEDL